MEKPFVIYRSSAGSGKTFTLALEYLKLALSQNGTYRNILAVTFTNKATKEMKSRIVEFLYELSTGKSGPVRDALLASTGLSNPELTDKAAAVLSQILHGYAYFSVMTIDSFFQKVIRAFAREIGLQAGFMLELDQQKVLDEVVDELLQDIGKPDKQELTSWLTRFAEERVEEGKAWDFKHDIKDLAIELLKENFKVQEEAYAAFKHPEADMPSIQHHQHHLRDIQTNFEQHLQKLGEEGLQQIARSGLSVDDFAYKASGVAGYFINLAALKSLEPGKRVRQALENPEGWTSKSSSMKRQIMAAVAGGLQQCLDGAVAFYDEHHRAYYSARQLQRFIYTYAVLKDIETKLEQYKKDNELMLISDASVFLKAIIGKDHTPFVYEKMGTFYQHFLIDEFQDTSGLQWNNFRPLIENSLDAGHANLVVGDVKQAIYRWRGGDWQLLLEKIQQDISDWRTQVQNLNRNFRSKKNIIDFNNTLFDVLPQLMAQEMLSRLTEVTDPILQEDLLHKVRVIGHAYEDAYQYLPDHYDTGNLWQGFVQVRLFNDEELIDEAGELMDWKDKVREQLPALVEQLQDQGYALRDIAFLVRNRREGKLVADTLMDYKSEGHAKPGYEYEVISPESLFLESSLSIGMLVDILRFLDNPKHVLAKGNILYKFHRLHHEGVSSDELHQLFKAAAHREVAEAEDIFYESLPKDFAALRPYLNKLPLYELVENLISIFALHQGTELAYLQAFQDAVLEYTKTEKGDLDSFLTWWDDKGKQTSIQISEQVDAMRILTIHKAKGLQFKTVILPFCDWSLDHNAFQQNIIWTYTQEQPFQEMGLMPMKYSKALINTVFSRDYYDEMLKAHLDNLNLLYVATTRAEECLYAFAQPRRTKQGATMNSIANALFLGLTGSAEDKPKSNPEKELLSLPKYWDEASGTFTLGYEPYEKKVSALESKRVLLKAYPAERWRNRLMVRPVSGNFFVQEAAGKPMQMNQAVLIKDVLAGITTAADLADRLQQVYFRRGIDAAQKDTLQQAVHQLLTIPELTTWFGGTYDKVVLRQPVYSGRQYFAVPERLMISGNKATVVHFNAGDEQHAREVSKSLQILQSTGYQTAGYIFDIATREVRSVKV